MGNHIITFVARRLFSGREGGRREEGWARRPGRATKGKKKEDESEKTFLALVEWGGGRAEDGNRKRGREA